jgi:SAM-dependent methyltransferase
MTVPAWLINLLACPSCQAEVRFEPASAASLDGRFVCVKCARAMPLRDGVLRGVPDEGYAASFGAQWNAFRRTQIDRFAGSGESAGRFAAETGWTAGQLQDAVVLDGGCGAGRFADIALQQGARVVAVDFSSAVDACAANLRELGHPADRFMVVQASLYDLPFKPGAFDYVYSIGVVQHTPDRVATVRALAAQLGRGELALWVYEKSWRSLLGYKYWFRLVTRHLSMQANWRLSRALVWVFYPAGRVLAGVPVAGKYLVRLLPFAYRSPGPGGSWAQGREWSLLDTFDNLSPAHDHPMTEADLRGWVTSAGLVPVRRLPAPSLALVARRPGPSAAVGT